MSDPHKVTRDFEQALCEYTGAPYCVTTTSCTMALLLAVRWFVLNPPAYFHPELVDIPRRTYVGVPMSIIHAGAKPTFRDERWRGVYQLKPLPVWDSARRFRRGMYKGNTTLDLARHDGVEQITLPVDSTGHMVCPSFHWSKVLGIQQGGAILHSDKHADAWFRKARFDGRTEGLDARQSKYDVLGWHAYMSPEVAAEGLMRLSLLEGDEPDLPNSDYMDLSQLEIFK